MRYRLEKMGCYLLIIILLPYIVTVFLSGPAVVSSTTAETDHITVQTEEGSMEMELEEYGIGILAREIPASYEMEAIKAQAVLVRTKIYKNMEKEGSGTVMDEEYWTREQMKESWGIAKYSLNYEKFEEAWQATEGQVLMYEEKLAYTPFFRLSNGNTRDGEEVLGEGYPYLKIKDCPLDIEAVEQIQTMTFDDIDAEVKERDTAGYVLKVRLGDETLSGEEFRNQFHLASGSFSIQEYEGRIRITTRGVGHGIGLSQNTANEMAKSGKTCQEILLYFYEGCEVKEAASFISLKKEE